MKKTMCELFAGVGGFRLGFDRLKNGWETVWFSQFEPGSKTQHAYNCYVEHFGNSTDKNGEITTGKDISTVNKEAIPEHSLLTAGFPCQDYSIARSKVTAMGIEGKKGVLWWQIYETLIAKNTPFCLFENVDRLVKSPAKQRGRDFGIMLTCLNNLGYTVEWRIVNAASYGAAQRRKRTYIFAYKDTTKYNKKLSKKSLPDIVEKEGFFANVFKINEVVNSGTATLPKDITKTSEKFSFNFENAGVMRDGKIYTAKIKEDATKPILLGSILENDVDEKYYITAEKMKKWVYLKGGKKIPRKAANGHEYMYSEGPVPFPDEWDKPARTLLTSEGVVSRTSHAVKDPKTERLRILTPKETERLQGFDDDWTDTGMTERMRYFCMGNALVVPMVTMMGKEIDKIIEKEK